MTSTPAPRSRVALIPCPDYDPGRVAEAVRRALEALGPLDALKPADGRVLLKPNAMMPKPAGHACCTHPSVVEALVGIFQDLGCTVAIGESSAGSQAGLTFTGRALKSSGLEDIGARTGAEVINFDHAGVIAVATENPLAPSIPVAKAAREAGLLVTVPKLKTHTFANIITGAVKNCYGLVPGQIKAEFHRRAPRPLEFFGLIRDLYRAVRPGLAVIDAVVGMEGDGPSAGRERRLGFIIASRDPVAADAVAAALIKVPPLSVLTTRLCHEAGLGRGDLDAIDVVGADLEESAVRDFKRPASVVVNPSLYRIILSLTQTRPEFDHDLCKRCGICADSCPVKAISKRDDKMVIDRDACIRCLCCCEVCPHQAVRPKRKNPLGNLLARLLSSRW